MKVNKIYSFMASPVLWSKNNRITKIEDIEKAPFYEELMFEINSNADIEPLISAKENKFKSDDLKLRIEEFQKNKDNLERKIVRLEARLKKLMSMEKYVNYLYGEVKDIYSAFPKEKKETLKKLLSSYAENGMFMQAELVNVKAKSRNFVKALITSSARKKANEKLNAFVSYCDEKNIYAEFQSDPSGVSKDVFEAIMRNELIGITAYFAELMGQINENEKEIENIKQDIIKGENSVKLANEGYERDNYVLIDLENEIIRKYAAQMKEKLFPPEIKEEPVVEETLTKEEAEPIAEIAENKKTSAIKNMFNQMKVPDLNEIKSQVKDGIDSIKHIFKKK